MVPSCMVLRRVESVQGREEHSMEVVGGPVRWPLVGISSGALPHQQCLVAEQRREAQPDCQETEMSLSALPQEAAQVLPWERQERGYPASGPTVPETCSAC
ncbi:hypothetical protein CgunFtcFv8_011346 [Champsocephalus gunnari]|uniref:Uncharacterized protein n=1 Tax=Champsocephalus gunnari TaxID=52237 RepID=A0AAN8HHB9_CHAGU|nr:hypothetical protein CgunFtcFv8_011346 [Champsocephalus gunnari]